MKKKLLLGVAVVMVTAIFLNGCGSRNDSADKIAELESEIAALKDAGASGNNENTAESKSEETSASEITEAPTPVVTEAPTPVVTEAPAPVVTEAPAPAVTEAPAPSAIDYSGSASTPSGDAVIELTGSASNCTITLKVTNNTSENASVWMQSQLMVFDTGASGQFDFFSNPSVSMIKIAPNSFGTVTYVITPEQYNSLSKISGEITFEGFTAFDNNKYEITVK